MTSVRPLGIVKTLAFQAPVSTLPLGVQQMLMHKKNTFDPYIETPSHIFHKFNKGITKLWLAAVMIYSLHTG